MSKSYEELILEYIQKFGESFPTDMAPQDDKEAMDIMEKCIRENKPYDPYENGANPGDLY